MDQVKIFYDWKGGSLTVWLGKPLDEYVCEETGDEVVLIKDKMGQFIGFEKLNFSVPADSELGVTLETVG